jgi:hypothetical protein
MDTTEMDLDDIKELLYAFTKHITGILEDGDIEDLYEPDLVEEFVDEFIASNEELTGNLRDAPMDEESY